MGNNMSYSVDELISDYVEPAIKDYSGDFDTMFRSWFPENRDYYNDRFKAKLIRLMFCESDSDERLGRILKQVTECLNSEMILILLLLLSCNRLTSPEDSIDRLIPPIIILCKDNGMNTITLKDSKNDILIITRPTSLNYWNYNIGDTIK
jgi:hypothetical protein